MTVGVERTPVGGGGPGGHVILGAFLAVVAGLAGLSILGRDLGKTPIDARPSVEASEAAAASVAPSVEPTEVASSEPTPEEVVPAPTPEPPPTLPPRPRGGVPTTSRTASVALVEPSTFVSTGIENITPDGGGYWRVVAGFEGAAWGFTSGRVSRIDPTTGQRRTWTTADDARFSAWAIFPARSGGIWIAGRDGVRRFDGTRFREGYRLPDSINTGIEAPDRTLWLLLSDQSLLHITGSTQTRIDTLAPGQDVGVSAIEIDRAGGIWCTWSRYGDMGNGEGWYTRFDGRSWSVIDPAGIAGLATPSMGLAAAPDGSMWTVTNGAVGRYARGAWTTWPFDGLQNVQGIAAGPNGTIWVAGDRLMEWNGHSWLVRPFPVTDSPCCGGGAWVAATASGVIASDGAGVFRVTATAIEPVGSSNAGAPVYGQIALAVSRSEVLVADADRLWRWADGRWAETDSSPLGPTPNVLVRMPSGRFAGLNQGESVLVSDETRDGTSTWSFLSPDPATALSVGPDGRLWVVHRESGSRAFTVRSYAEDGGTWTEISRTPPTDLLAQPNSVTIARNGTIWLGSAGGSNGIGSGLVRYAAGRWEDVKPRGNRVSVVVNEVAVAGDGSVWVAGRDGSDGAGPPWLLRSDGELWTDPFGGIAPDGDPHIAAGPDGSIWATNGVGLARFDGVRRTTYATGLGIWQIRVAGDGGVWLQAEGGVARLVSTGDPAVSR